MASTDAHQLHHNPDLALHASHEHQHPHLHHSAAAEKGRTDEVVYEDGDKDQLGPDNTRLEKNGHFVPNTTADKEVQPVAVYDAEKGAATNVRNTSPYAVTEESEEPQKRGFIRRYYMKFRPLVHAFLFLLITGWWIASLVLHRNDMNWIIPFLLWLFISLRLLFFHVPITVVSKPMHFVWNNTGVRFANLVPEKLRIPLAAALCVAVIIIGAMASPEAADNTRGNRAVSLFGLVVFIAVLWATSRNRKMIRWHTVIVGMLMQFIIGLFVLRTQAGNDIFSFISELARDLLGFANLGTAFLTDATVPNLPWFFTGVIPPIIFFVAFVQLLFFWGVVQWFIGKFAVFFFWSLRVSGAEAVVAAASPFIGQGESAMLIKPFVAHLTQAELHQVMCSGFATIAGSVLVAYIHLGVNGQALISSCVMSIPASLAVSKLRYPETEETLTAGRVVVPKDPDQRATNFIHAFANGAWLGLKIAGMIVATLLCIIALIGLIDGILTWFGHYINIGSPTDPTYDLTLELILGYLFYPVAFLLGVPRNGDLLKVSRLIGIKVIANEFVAYDLLQTDPAYSTLTPRSRLISTFALCGFGNIGSLGTQIGVLSQISPARSGDVAKLAISALLSGIISTLSSASIAGLLVTNEAAYFSPPVNSTTS